MKSYRLFLFASLLSLVSNVFVSCSKDDPKNDDESGQEVPSNPAPTPSAPPAIAFEVPAYTVLEINEYTAAEIGKRFGELPFNLGAMSALFDTSSLERAFLLRDAKLTAEMRAKTGSKVSTLYKEAVIQYTSVDHTGKPIELSGRLSWQDWTCSDEAAVVPKSEPKVLIIENHYTITDNASAPSKSKSLMDAWSYNVTSAMTMNCDYQGYGISATSVHPYLNEELTARQQVDFVKAALHWVITSCPSVSLKNYCTYNMGYSQGGAVAVAVQKYLEQNETALLSMLKFRGTMAGDGPYDLEKTLAYYFENGTLEMPVVLPMIVRGMMASYPELFDGIKAEDYFNPVFLAMGGYPNSLFDMIDSKQYNIVTFMGLIKQLTGSTSMKIEDVVSDDAMNPQSKIFQALAQALKRNNVLTGWTPKHPVAFYHCEKDNVVPFCNLDLLGTGIWPESTYRIEKITAADNHLLGSIVFYLQAATLFNVN